MHVYLANARVRLNDSDLLGEGGEARVFRHGALALKLFHSPGPHKAQKLAAFPQGLPAEVVAPSSLVHDGRGAIIGYAMPAVLGHEELARLGSRRWRGGAVPSARVVELFEQLGTVLDGLHRAGVVVGDLNDGNVLFDAGVKLIDADSMQFKGLPCVVGHERTLAPELYGVDLTCACRFSEATDWYAWNVLLFQSLLYVHPYGGVHQRLPTLLRRAQARHSVLRPDVAYPRGGVHFRVLPDAALHHFERVFDRGERGPAPRLDLRWARCACGLEHARPSCPDCQARGPSAARQALRSHGRCTARTLFRTPGRVLAAALQGGVRYVYEEAGRVRREDGSLVLEQPAAPGTWFGIAGRSTWVADREGRVTRVEDGRVVERASTGTRLNVPVITARYRLEQEWIVEHATGARVGQALEGQTWLWSADRLGLALYRAGSTTQVGLLRAGQAGLSPVRHVPGGRGPVVDLKGRLVDAACAFDFGHALLSATTELDGRERRALWLFNAAGQRVAHGEGHGQGRALLGGRVVCATDQGLLALENDSGVLVPGTLFTDTEPFVAESDELLAQPDGSLLVMGHEELVSLSLSP